MPVDLGGERPGKRAQLLDRDVRHAPRRIPREALALPHDGGSAFGDRLADVRAAVGTLAAIGDEEIAVAQQTRIGADPGHRDPLLAQGREHAGCLGSEPSRIDTGTVRDTRHFP